MFKISINVLHPRSLLLNFRSYKSENVRVRFAPSPTGYLHLGGLRTALYNYLFAKKHNGKFILRIEDTDQSRLVLGAIEQLHEDLKWSGLEIDEGPFGKGAYGPYLQSQRLMIYKEKIEQLLESGSAYRCFCSDKRLQLLRREALRLQEIPKYDNKCRHLSVEEVQSRLDRGERSCIRFQISDTEETFDDLIYGRISYNVSLNEGDPVIFKSDGYPTYHFANVVDDHLMDITHVLRGVEWQISTTKHLLLYRALGWTPPSFGHLPLLMNADGTKLSKRQGDIRISHYRENNVFPLALINFIVHSGGGFSKDSERHLRPKCYSIDELTEQFDLCRINTHSGKLMAERLSEFNKLTLQKKLEDDDEQHELVRRVIEMLKQTFPDRLLDNSLQLDEKYVCQILLWASNRISNLSELVSKDLEFVWVMPKPPKIDVQLIPDVKLLKEQLEVQEHLEADSLNVLFKDFCKARKLQYGGFMKTMRLVLSGLKEGPSVAEMIVILGKKNALERIEGSINKSRGER